MKKIHADQRHTNQTHARRALTAAALRSLTGVTLCTLTGVTLCALIAGPLGATPPVTPVSAPSVTPAQAPPAFLAPDEDQPPAAAGETPSPGTDRYDFGTRSSASATPIEHTFLLRNPGPAPLTVDHVQPSCGCTTALTDGAAGAAPAVIPPGGRFRVRVAVDPGHLSAGQASKSVWVFLRGQAAPAATLLVTGTVRPAASFAPGILNFGQVRAGETPALDVTVTLDPALAPSAPRLVSSDPDVLVTARPGPPAPAGSVTRTFPVTQTYSVRLSPRAHLGILGGSLSLASRTGGPVAAGGAFATVPVVGAVVGDVSASPSSVAFGSVAAGRAATLRVALTGATPDALGGLKAGALGPYVTARLGPGGTPGSPRTLDVSVSPQAPPGTIQTRVTVTTAGGQRLVIPVFAYVTAGGDAR